MKKNILVATDFSQRSFEVIQIAFEFSEKHNFKVHLVHILETSFFDKIKDVKDIYQNSLRHLQEKFPNIQEDQFHCEDGILEEKIEVFVKKLDAFMIILGSAGERTSILKRFLGSSTKSIVRAVSVPCLVIKSDTKIVDFDSIMLGTDLSDDSKKHIEKIHILFPNSRIELLYSYLIPFEGRLSFYGFNKKEAHLFQNNMKQIALEEAYSFYDRLDIDKKKVKISLIKEGLDPESFVEQSDELMCNLIALHTTGHFSFFAFDLLEHANKDILITKIN